MRLMLLLFALLSTGCATTKAPSEAPPTQANPYERFYKSYAKSPVAKTGLPPRIYRGQDQVSDYRHLLEDGYDILGYSSFVAGDIPPEQALEQADKINADLVLVYTRHSSAMPLALPNRSKPQAQTDEQAKDKPTGRLITPQAPDYEYFASYWTQLPPQVLGLHVQAPDENKPDSGLPIVAVIKDSPAASANIKAGDKLLRIGDTDMRNVEALTQATQRYAGQSVEIVFAHEAETMHKTIELNTRNP